MAFKAAPKKSTPASASASTPASTFVPTPAPEPTPVPAAVTPSPAVIVAPPPTAKPIPLPEFDRELLDRLRHLTPEQRAAIRSSMSAEGILASTPRTRADGSVICSIRIDPDLVEQIKTWAEESRKSFEEQVQELVDVTLSGYLQGDWGMQMVPQAAQAVPPAATAK